MSSVPREYHAQSTTVLVVEDDPDTQTFLTQLLKTEGYAVFPTTSGSAALALLNQQPVDLLLLDVGLPDMSGYEVCAQVRKSWNGSMPVMMMSALTQPHNIVQGLETGADEYLKKPLSSQEVLARISHVLRRHQTIANVKQENGQLHDRLRQSQAEVQQFQQLSQTESLMRQELLHNVATHMQALCGIVDAETRKLPPSLERDTVQRIRSRVHGAALVYQTTEALASDPVAIGSVIRTITTALKGMYRPWKRLKVTLQGEEVLLANQLAAPLAVVINELVTNCFKYAFPENRFGEIVVAYGSDAGRFWLDVQDNGVGFDPATPVSGVGRRTIQQMVQALGGTVRWQSSDQGTSARVEVPVGE